MARSAKRRLRSPRPCSRTSRRFAGRPLAPFCMGMGDWCRVNVSQPNEQERELSLDVCYGRESASSLRNVEWHRTCPLDKCFFGCQTLLSAFKPTCSHSYRVVRFCCLRCRFPRSLARNQRQPAFSMLRQDHRRSWHGSETRVGYALQVHGSAVLISTRTMRPSINSWCPLSSPLCSAHQAWLPLVAPSPLFPRRLLHSTCHTVDLALSSTHLGVNIAVRVARCNALGHTHYFLDVASSSLSWHCSVHSRHLRTAFSISGSLIEHGPTRR